MIQNYLNIQIINIFLNQWEKSFYLLKKIIS